jgi:hypothetical protein
MLFDFLGEAVCNPAMAEIVQEHSRTLRNHLSESLRKGQARGEIDPYLDAEVAAAILICVIDGSKTLSARDPKLDITRSVDPLKTLITRFLRHRALRRAKNNTGLARRRTCANPGSAAKIARLSAGVLSARPLSRGCAAADHQMQAIGKGAGRGKARAVQRSLLKFIEKRDLSPPRAAA